MSFRKYLIVACVIITLGVFVYMMTLGPADTHPTDLQIEPNPWVWIW